MPEQPQEYTILHEDADSIEFAYKDRALKPLVVPGLPGEDRPYDTLVQVAIANTIAEECRTSELQIAPYKFASHSVCALGLSAITAVSYCLEKADFHPATTTSLLAVGLLAVISGQKSKVDNIRQHKQRLQDSISYLID